VIGVQRGHEPFGGVVKHNEADADPHVELETVSVGKEWLIHPDWFPLVVEGRPAVTNPARGNVIRSHLRFAIDHDDAIGGRIAARDSAGFGLHLPLNRPSKAVGV
jgi:hypothetical protein